MSRPLRKKVYLFLSVDVEGSTKFKSQPFGKDKSSKNSVQHWLFFFQDFYSEFPKIFIGECRGLKVPGKPPQIWKTLGDEIIFSTEIKVHQDAVNYVTAFKLAIEKYGPGHRWTEHTPKLVYNFQNTGRLAYPTTETH